MPSLAVVAVLGAALTVPAAVRAAVHERARGALGQDDACIAGSDAGNGACALQALQQRSARGLVGDAAAAAAAPEAASDPWIWNEEVIIGQWTGGNTIAYKEFESYTQGAAQTVTYFVCYFCERWMAYNWVKISFWAQEVLRRTEALPASPTPDQVESMRLFSRQASFLTCVWDFDPRMGTDWSVPVHDYMTKVAQAPAESLELPKLEGWFTQHPQSRSLYAIDACMVWVHLNFCDMGFLAKELRGNKDSVQDGGVCWGQVAQPKYGLNIMNLTIDLPFNLHILAQDDDFAHPEWERCQEHPFNRDTVSNNCPMFGHYPKNMWGLTDFSWGDEPEKGSKRYNDVLACDARLGVPSEDLHMNFWDSFPYADNVGLMDTPGWREDQIEIMKKTMERTGEVITKRMTDTVRDVVAIANTTDWTGIAGAAAGTFASPESQAAWQAVGEAFADGNKIGNYFGALKAATAAMRTANASSAAKAAWGLASAAAKAEVTARINEIGAARDVVGEIRQSFNDTIFKTNWSDDSLYHHDPEELSMKPK